LAGDAFTTMNVDSVLAVLTKRKRISRPPTPVNYDWKLCAESVRKLDALNPLTFACGHGMPMAGPDAADQFTWFAEHFPVPPHGRYVAEPAKTSAEEWSIYRRSRRIRCRALPGPSVWQHSLES
jgi:hypothetical protein